MKQESLEVYINRLKALQTKVDGLEARNKTIADIPRLTGREQQGFQKAGEDIFEFFIVPATSKRLQCIKLIDKGGECFIFQGRLGNDLYTIKVGHPPFNLLDYSGRDEIEKRYKLRISETLRMRFQEGLSTQKAAHHALKRKKFNTCGIPDVMYASTVPPVFSVMQWVDAVHFKQFIRQYGEDKARIMEVYYNALRGFDIIHGLNIVHRDVKPKNILIDRHDKPWLIDFTLMKNLESEQEITVIGTVLGDALFSPPEQICEGANPKDIDQRSDQYSLGWNLYFAITGQYPPKHIHRKTLRDTINRNVPSAFRAMFIKMTSQKKADRYMTTNQVVEEFKSICNAEGINFGRNFSFGRERLELPEKEDDDTAVDTPDPIAQQLNSMEDKIKFLQKQLELTPHCPLTEDGDSCYFVEKLREELRGKHIRPEDIEKLDFKGDKNAEITKSIMKLFSKGDNREE